MTKEEILNGNNLIAEFMGFINTTPTDKDFNIYKHPETKKLIETMSMQYHSSWDWLMPVVRKIVILCIKDDEEDGLFLSQYYDSILDTIPLAVIEDSYKVVVEFIKYYNTCQD